MTIEPGGEGEGGEEGDRLLQFYDRFSGASIPDINLNAELKTVANFP